MYGIALYVDRTIYFVNSTPCITLPAETACRAAKPVLRSMKHVYENK
jgi:hypothetical protein